MNDTDAREDGDAGVEQDPVRKRDWISDTLEAADIVNWDRFVGPMKRAGEEVIDVYGWIERDDNHEDFVWIRFYLDSEWCEYTTSSAEYSHYLAKAIHGADEEDLEDNHMSCRRVEDAFDVENAIELTEQQTLVADGGLYQKYEVEKDGEPVEEFCFVLKPESDGAALEALQTYAEETDDRKLAADLMDKIHRIMANNHSKFFEEGSE